MTIHSFFEQTQLTFQLNKEELSVSHPLLLKFLTENSHDPDVARLIDAFVYSYGSLNAHDTKHFPELPRSLISLFWPHLLKPVPSTTVIKFKHQPKTNVKLRTTEHIIPALTKITTKPINVSTLGESIRTSNNLDSDDDLSLPIEFRTTGVLRLSAFSQAEIHYTQFEDYSKSTSKGLEIKFTTQDNHFSLTDVTELQFFMGDDLYTGKQLFLWLTQYLETAVFIINGIEYRQEDLKLSIPALKEQMPLIPFPKNVFQGYRLLLEYFSFPENFLFCKFDNLNLPNQVFEASEMTLLLTFSRDLPHDMQLTSKTIQVNCVPAVNLFHKDLEPITLDGKKINYPLMPKLNAHKYYDIYEINNVYGYLLKKVPLRTKRHYWPFESFSHQKSSTLGHSPSTNLELYYQHLVLEDVTTGGFKHAIALKRSDELEHIGDDELIAVNALCTNRYAPAYLSVGDLELTQLADASIQASNITRPTMPLYPTMNPYLLDILMSGLVLNSSSLLNKDALIMALSLYDFAGMNDSAHANLAQLRDGALDELESFNTQMYYEEEPVDGIKTIMSVKQIGVFESEGDLYLFGTVIATFLSMYSNVNTFHQLELVNKDNQERWTWSAHPLLKQSLVN